MTNISNFDESNTQYNKCMFYLKCRNLNEVICSYDETKKKLILSELDEIEERFSNILIVNIIII